MRICIATANTLSYPQGGHLWVFLNWALGLQSLGHEVVWMDCPNAKKNPAPLGDQIRTLRDRLAGFGLADSVAIAEIGEPTDSGKAHEPGTVSVDEIATADLLLNFRYDFPAWFVERFARSAFVDIDPGILQHNVRAGHLFIPKHDTYFTVGEGVGAGSTFGDMGVSWFHTPPCVALDQWPVVEAPSGAPFTTVSHWYTDDWIVESEEVWYKNDKKSAYEPFLDLPRKIKTPLELAIMLNGDPQEKQRLQNLGWRVREAHGVASTLDDFRSYVQGSAGEFGCARPAYARWNTGWLSDRTVCYLASGKPAVIQNTGPSKILPDRQGIFRFATVDDAADCFKSLERDYSAQCAAARSLAEELFDARKLMPKMLEHAWG